MKKILERCGRGELESNWSNWIELNFKIVLLKNMEHAAWVIWTIHIISCSLCGKKEQQKHFTNYPYLWSMEARKSYRFGRTWGWVNNDNFPWTTWLKYPTLHKSQIRLCCQYILNSKVAIHSIHTCNFLSHQNHATHTTPPQEPRT